MGLQRPVAPGRFPLGNALSSSETRTATVRYQIYGTRDAGFDIITLGLQLLHSPDYIYIRIRDERGRLISSWYSFDDNCVNIQAGMRLLMRAILTSAVASSDSSLMTGTGTMQSQFW